MDFQSEYIDAEALQEVALSSVATSAETETDEGEKSTSSTVTI